eukprot:2408660-Pyramimonas_sp.AAC.1
MLHTFRGPAGSKSPTVESSHGTTAPLSAHPSHVSWPHGGLHRRPQWEGPHATTAPMSAHRPQWSLLVSGAL